MAEVLETVYLPAGKSGKNSSMTLISLSRAITCPPFVPVLIEAIAVRRLGVRAAA
jgi:hypothetical protein